MSINTFEQQQVNFKIFFLHGDTKPNGTLIEETMDRISLLVAGSFFASDFATKGVCLNIPLHALLKPRSLTESALSDSQIELITNIVNFWQTL